MKPGYIYIENDVPVWNAERKPIINPDHYPEMDVNEWKNTTLKEWQESCIEIDNIHDYSAETIGKKYPCFAQLRGRWYFARSHYMNHWIKFTPGQKAFIDGQTIVKLEQ